MHSAAMSRPEVRRQGDKKLLGSFLWYWVRGIFRNGGIFCFICHFQNFSFNFLSWLKRHQKIVKVFSPFKLLGSLIVSERQKSLYVIKREERGNVKKALRYTKNLNKRHLLKIFGLFSITHVHKGHQYLISHSYKALFCIFGFKNFLKVIKSS